MFPMETSRSKTSEFFAFLEYAALANVFSATFFRLDGTETLHSQESWIFTRIGVSLLGRMIVRFPAPTLPFTLFPTNGLLLKSRVMFPNPTSAITNRVRDRLR